MFDRLAKHHLGFIVPLEEKAALEQRYGRCFVFDAVQGTHVLFIDDTLLHTRIELICQEGRVAKQKPGFAHVCYTLKDRIELKTIEDHIALEHLGYPLTPLELSGSRECGWVTFYYIKNIGVIELNVGQKE